MSNLGNNHREKFDKLVTHRTLIEGLTKHFQGSFLFLTYIDKIVVSTEQPNSFLITEKVAVALTDLINLLNINRRNINLELDQIEFKNIQENRQKISRVWYPTHENTNIPEIPEATFKTFLTEDIDQDSNCISSQVLNPVAQAFHYNNFNDDSNFKL